MLTWVVLIGSALIGVAVFFSVWAWGEDPETEENEEGWDD